MNPPASPPSSSEHAPSVQLTTDAIIASYIHEISDRHRPAEHRPEPASEPCED